jgi:polysaccharide biosynthesis protein PslH
MRPAPGPTRVLAVTSQLPWPLDRGGHIRTFNTLRGLARELDVTLVVPLRTGEDGSLPHLRSAGIEVRGIPIAGRSFPMEARRLLTSELRGLPYVLYGRHAHGAILEAYRSLAATGAYSVAYLDHLDSFQYACTSAFRATVLDLHNIYSLLVARSAEEQTSWPRRSFLRREARLLQRLERTASSSVSAVFSVSESERVHFEHLGAQHAFLIPNGVDFAHYQQLPRPSPEAPPTVLYVGTMSWGPNAQAVEFLARDVLPAVRRQLPEAQLQLVGRDPAPPVLALTELPGVHLAHNVPDVRPYLAAATLLAVPLDSGGGTRLKILEAFAAGLPVVSTPIGAEGIDAQDGSHLRIADRVGFAQAIVELMINRSLADAMAARAKELARSTYDWDAIGRAACAAITSVL